jgi:hypothetical protein
MRKMELWGTKGIIIHKSMTNKHKNICVGVTGMTHVSD